LCGFFFFVFFCARLRIPRPPPVPQNLPDVEFADAFDINSSAAPTFDAVATMAAMGMLTLFPAIFFFRQDQNQISQKTGYDDIPENSGGFSDIPLDSSLVANDYQASSSGQGSGAAKYRDI
jgi:hypothetical protein